MFFVPFVQEQLFPMSDLLTDLEERREIAIRSYSGMWTRLAAEWTTPAVDDRAWLMYAANYLFRTSNVRWAMDPLSLRQRIPAAPAVDYSALTALDYVVLTHRHADHLDLQLLALLKDFHVRWIVPEALLEPLRSLDLPPEKLTIARPLEPLQLGALTLIPFEGRHWEADASRPGGRRGVPALGYLAEFNGNRWLFPGDTRTYDASQLPAFGSVDGLFAHLWLGRGQALSEQPPLLDAFGRFCLDLQPRRIVITHLNEWGRSAHEMWTPAHARLAVDWFGEHAPGLSVWFSGLFLAGKEISQRAQKDRQKHADETRHEQAGLVFQNEDRGGVAWNGETATG